MKLVGTKITHKAERTLHTGESITLDDGRYVVSMGASAGAEATLSFVEPVAKVENKKTVKKTEDK